MRRAVSASLRPPAHVGDTLASVATPSLLVDLDRVAANCEAMGRALGPHVTSGAVKLRPHAKAVKSVEFLRWLLGRSDSGVTPSGLCCQTVSEADAAVAAGCKDVLLTNQLWAPAKIERLAELSYAAEQDKDDEEDA